MGAGASPPRSQASREAFVRNPAAATAALGIPAAGQNSGGGATSPQPRPAPTSRRQAPVSLLGSQPASNARSTGRSLVKDPVAAGSLLR